METQRTPSARGASETSSMSRYKRRGWAGYAIASLHSRIVQVLGTNHPQLLEGQRLLSAATDKFLAAEYEEAHALAHRGIELLGSRPAENAPTQPPPPPPLSPPSVTDGVFRGLARVLDETRYANRQLKVVMVSPAGALVTLEFKDQTGVNLNGYSEWLTAGSLVFIEFQAVGGKLQLISLHVVWHTTDGTPR